VKEVKEHTCHCILTAPLQTLQPHLQKKKNGAFKLARQILRNWSPSSKSEHSHPCFTTLFSGSQWKYLFHFGVNQFLQNSGAHNSRTMAAPNVLLTSPFRFENQPIVLPSYFFVLFPFALHSLRYCQCKQCPSQHRKHPGLCLILP
jgi:hypothetical protein